MELKMKKKYLAVWQHQPNVKNIVDVILEKVVTFEDKEYDIPDKALAGVVRYLRTGETPEQHSKRTTDAWGQAAAGDWDASNEALSDEPADRTYNVDQGIKTLVKRYNLNAAGEKNLNDIVSGYAGSGDIGAKAIRALVNAPPDFPLFSHKSPKYPSHKATEPLLRLKYDAKAGAVGQGELLASLLYGTPSAPNPGLERDVDLRGGPNVGGWHVKYTSSNTGSTPWGESKGALKAFRDTIEASAPELWSVLKNRLDSSGETSGFSSATAADIMTAAGLDPEKFDSYANILDQAMAAMAGSGEAGGVLFATPNGFIFKPASQVKYGGTMKSGRITVAHANEPAFKERIKKSGDRASAVKAKEQAAWNSIKDLPLAKRYTLGRGESLSKNEANALMRMRGISTLDVITVDPDTDEESVETKTRTQAQKSWTNEDQIAIMKALINSDPESLQTDSYQRKGDFLYEKVRRILKLERVLNEELTRADKKEVDRMIAKRIEKDRTEQKRIIRKEIESELKSSLGTSFFGNPGKVRKAIEEIARAELSREMGRGSKMEEQVVEITKKIIKKLYREISHAYNPVIDRIKL